MDTGKTIPFRTDDPKVQRENMNLPFSKIAEFKDIQVTGVTVTDKGRIFACFPRWRDGVPFSVVEVRGDGSYTPYPDVSWNSFNGKQGPEKFVCIQSVVAHGSSLFVLDPANPEMKGVVGRPRLYEFDLETNHLKRSWEFSEEVAPKKSYLNDLRVDEANQCVYITESAIGGILIVDMKTSEIRRVLHKDSSTRAEWTMLNVKGKPFTQGLLPARMHSDGIAFDGEHLYFHALTAYHLYRISAADLNNRSLDDKELSKRVEDLGKTPAPDGMIFDRFGNLYMADLENGAIVYRTPSGEIKTLVKHDLISWADTLSIYNDELYFTDSHLIDAKPGQPALGMTFEIYKIALPDPRH